MYVQKNPKESLQHPSISYGFSAEKQLTHWLCPCGLRFSLSKFRYLSKGFNLGAWSPQTPQAVNGERQAAFESQADLSKTEAPLGGLSGYKGSLALRLLLAAPGRCAEVGRKGSMLLQIKTKLFGAALCFSFAMDCSVRVARYQPSVRNSFANG